MCPTGWRSAPERSIQLGKLAVETGLFPLYEVENGQYRLTKKMSKIKPLDEYLKLQGRFRHLTEDLRKEIQERTNQEYTNLLKKTEQS